jgi:hypothetical protein
MPDTDPVENPNIYRAISKKRWYVAAEQRVLSAAFMLRDGERGISVLKRDGCSVDVCRAGLGTCEGEFILETQQILALGLTIGNDEPDAPQFNENHAEILGLPPHENPREAEDAATLLAARARLHYDRHNNY